MKKNILSMAFVATMMLMSCNHVTKTQDARNSTQQTVNPDNNIVKQSLTDTDGKTLDMIFDNDKGLVTINFEGDKSVLKAEPSASGIWYTNEHYELTGKGHDITLKKHGNVVFEHEDDIINVEAKNDMGDTLNLTFNNTEGTVQAYLNGGDEIYLMDKKPASGIWYANDHYELSGKGNSYELKKDGKTIFKN